MRGLTLSSSASRHASTASSRRSAPSGVAPAASRRTSAVGVRVDRHGPSAPHWVEQDVAVEGGQVDQRPVERVPLGPGGPGLLPPLQLLERAGAAAGGGRRALAGAAGAERLLQRLGLRAVQLGRQRGRLRLGRRRPAGRRRRSRRRDRSARPAPPAPPRAARAPPGRGPAAGPGRRGPGPPAPPTRPSSGSMPSRRTSTSATASGGGRAQRDHPAARPDGDRRRRRGGSTARRAGRPSGGGGSSTALSSALDAASVSRSASSISTTCQRPATGSRAAVSTSARISFTAIDRPSGTTRRTSAWVPARTVWQPAHSPQPRRRARTAGRRRTPGPPPTGRSPAGR